MVQVAHSFDLAIGWMMHFEQNHPFGADRVRIHSRWASLDAGIVSKEIVARLVAAAPTHTIATPKTRFCHDAGVCFEKDERARRVPLNGTVILCKTRLEIAGWKKVFSGNPNAVCLERYDHGPSVQKRILGKSIWIVSKSVFQKMDVYPARLICTYFGMADNSARFTWVVGHSPSARNAIHFSADKSLWVRPRIVSHRIHRLFKIPDVHFDIPKRRMTSEFTCCVCYEETVERRLQLECTHRICFGCLKGCVSTGHYLCPVCRHPMDHTFVTEDADDDECGEELQNYHKTLREVVKSKPDSEKWVVFQKTTHSEIGCGLYNFVYKNDDIFYASAAASHFPVVDLSESVDAVVVSEEHEPCTVLFRSFLCRSLSHRRTKPLVVHCLCYDLNFAEKINEMLNAV